MAEAMSAIEVSGGYHLPRSKVQNGDYKTYDSLSFSFATPTLPPYFRSRRKRRRSESSLYLVSISVHVILIGLLLHETSSLRRCQLWWADALVITSPTVQRQQQNSDICHRGRYDVLHRRQFTQVRNGHVTSDPVFNDIATTTTITQIHNGSMNLSINKEAQQPQSTTGLTAPMNGNANYKQIFTSQSLTASPSLSSPSHLPDELDRPRPTANGGYTHTHASRAKISAGNKGKVPWNKGKTRSDEERARIAAGVRAKNRELFLKKLQEMGLTEEQYEVQKKEARRKRDAERRARKTVNGGYTPTIETRAKISKALKETHASGLVKKRHVDPSKVRKGFTHTEETRRRISESLKKRWSTDDTYREHMTHSYSEANSREETRKKISAALKKRWEDPKFRDDMTSKMTESRTRRGVVSHSSSYRKKISDAMKKKWQDPAYRKKTLTSIQMLTQSRTSTTPPRRVKKTKPVPKKESVGMELITPLSPADLALRKKNMMLKKNGVVNTVVATPVEPRKASTAKDKVKGIEKVDSDSTPSSKVLVASPQTNEVKKKREKIKKPEQEDGSVSRLREERRDLFDLLYGDEDVLRNNGEIGESGGINDAEESTFVKMGLVFGDEDLDAFDPYGLDDY
jgi:hypothetical protein